MSLSTPLTSEQEERLVEIGRAASEEHQKIRPAGTSATYSNAIRRYQEYCDAQGFEDGDSITDYKTIVYAEHVTNSATHIDDPSRRICFKTAEARINGLGDLYKTQVLTGDMLESATSYPWKLQQVRTLLSNMARREQLERSQQPNTGLVKQMMTSDNQTTALRLAFEMLSPGLALVARLALLLAPPNAMHGDDLCHLRWLDMCLDRYPCAAEVFSQPGDSIGPDPSTGVLFGGTLVKHVKRGVPVINGAVRFAEPALCPQLALACLAAFVFGRSPGRLNASSLRGYVLSAPTKDNSASICKSYLGQEFGKLLRAAGCQCDVAGRKSATTHLLKRFGIKSDSTAGVSIELISENAGHSHSTTRQSYLPINIELLHKSAGYGNNYQSQHFLSRQKALPSEDMLELAIPGLSALLQHLSPGYEGLEDTIEALGHLRTVLIQDLPLLDPETLADLLKAIPHLAPLFHLPSWPGFSSQVCALHAGDVAKRRELFEFANDPAGAHLAVQKKALSEVLPGILAPFIQQLGLPAPPTLQPPPPLLIAALPAPAETEPTFQVPALGFDIRGLPSVSAAWGAYTETCSRKRVLEDGGGGKGRKRKLWESHSAGERFSSFVSGIALEVGERARTLGSMEKALAELDIEMLGFQRTKTFSPLQRICKNYSNVWKAKRKCP